MENRPSIKRFLLYMVVGGLVLAALIGIYVLLFGTFGPTEERILLTTLGISYFSVTSLACAAVYEKKRQGLLALPGLALSVIGLALFLPGMWADWLEIDAYGKTTAIIAIFSFSFAHACLLSFVTLQRHLAWVYYAAVGSILTLAAIVTAMILFDKGDWLLRLAGAVGILDGCLSLCIPILHRLGGNVSVPTTIGSYERIELICPRCGQRGVYSVGSIKCCSCSLVIDIHIEPDSHGPG